MREQIEQFPVMLHGSEAVVCYAEDVEVLEAENTKLVEMRGVQEHRIMDLQDRFDNLKVDYEELEKQISVYKEIADKNYKALTEKSRELEALQETYHGCKDMHRERGEIIAKLEQKYDTLQGSFNRLYESNNRQSDIIYDLKVERDELIEFLNCIITRYDNDDSVSGIYLDKVRAYVTRIKDSE